MNHEMRAQELDNPLIPRVGTVEAEVDVGDGLFLLVLGGVQRRTVEDGEGVDEDRVEGGLPLLRKRQERMPEMEMVMLGQKMLPCMSKLSW